MGDFEASNAAIQARGWGAVAPGDYPALVSIMARSRLSEQHTPHHTETYARPDMPASFIVLVDFTFQNRRFLICHLYTTDAEAPTPQEELEELLGGAPTRVDSNRTLLIWAPAPRLPEALGVQYTFSPPTTNGVGEHLRLSSASRGAALSGDKENSK